MKQIKNALISVYYKDDIAPLLIKMVNLDINLFSTGGTYDFIQSLGLPVTKVEDITGYPSIFGGRVKTLHPSVMGGILMRRGVAADIKEAEEYKINSIDLVVVDLYPFAETVAQGRQEDEVIEKIDIGGISLIRAAAKNFNDVVVIPGKEAYPILDSILDNEGTTDLKTRKLLAAAAFDVSSDYDVAIYKHLSSNDQTPSLKISCTQNTPLRYGENPHQKGVFYGDLSGVLEQIHGKELSYNNLLDIDTAIALIGEFNEPTVAILKHNNPCGLASRAGISEAWTAALQADPLSAFGGIIISNRKVDGNLAEKINEIFFEVLIAPEYDNEALAIFKAKKNRIILKSLSEVNYTNPVRSVLNGYLAQDRDEAAHTAEDLKTVTNKIGDNRQIENMLFANKIVKHTKSNAIVLANNKQLIGIGTGQTSRIDAMRQSIEKAKAFNLPLENSVAASDAFFPFADSIKIAWQAGVKAFIQPGGSIRDKESIDFCNNKNITMVFTEIRHFKH